MKPGKPVKVYDLKHALSSGVRIGESTDAEMEGRWAWVDVGDMERLLSGGERALSEREARSKIRGLIARRRKAIARELARLDAIAADLKRGVLPMAKVRR